MNTSLIALIVAIVITAVVLVVRLSNKDGIVVAFERRIKKASSVQELRTIEKEIADYYNANVHDEEVRCVLFRLGEKLWRIEKALSTHSRYVGNYNKTK